MARFPELWLEELRSRVDIVQLIGSYVQLKKNGSRYVGLCPFHHETAGSFSVDAQKQMYHCFGCKAGGTVFNFVMEMEHLSFPEAVAYLAEQAGLPMPEMQNDPDYEKKRSQKERLYEANKEAARIYHSLLWQSEGAETLAYLRKKRGLSDEVIRRFGLGAAPMHGGVGRQLMQKGFTEDELVSAGIMIRRERPEAFDMFRQGRVMFPIIDSYGNVLGFGGRALGSELPKYLNTGDTPVFNKRMNIYGANLLRKSRHLNRVILVEGYMDVVALSQFGIEGAAATLGTALTPEQAHLLGRFAPVVHLSYDGDGAGQKAILRGLDVFEESGIPAKVMDFPDKLDPDEFLRQRGTDAFNALSLLSATQYRMIREKEKYDLATDDGRLGYAKGCAVFLKRVKEPVELDLYISRLSNETGFDKAVLYDQVGVKMNAQPAKVNVSPPVRRRPDAGAKEGRTKTVLLAFLAADALPKGSLQPADFEGVDRALCEALQSGESARAFMERQPDETSRHRVSEILNSIPEEDSDTLAHMAQQALKAFHRQQMDSRITAADDSLTLEEAMALSKQMMGLKDRKQSE